MPTMDPDAFREGADDMATRYELRFREHLDRLDWSEPKLTDSQRECLAAHRTARDVQHGKL